MEKTYTFYPKTHEVLDMWTNPKYWPEPVVVDGIEEDSIVEPTQELYELTYGEIPCVYHELYEEITQDPRVTYFELFESKENFTMWVFNVGPRTYQFTVWHHDQAASYEMKRWLSYAYTAVAGGNLDVSEYEKGRKDSENDYREGWYGTEISNKTLKQLIQTSVGDEYTDEYYEGYFDWTNELRRQQQLEQRG